MPSGVDTEITPIKPENAPPLTLPYDFLRDVLFQGSGRLVQPVEVNGTVYPYIEAFSGTIVEGATWELTQCPTTGALTCALPFKTGAIDLANLESPNYGYYGSVRYGEYVYIKELNRLIQIMDSGGGLQPTQVDVYVGEGNANMSIEGDLRGNATIYHWDLVPE